MNRSQAEENVKLLCHVFRVKQPRIKWHHGRRSWAFRRQWEIRFSRKVETHDERRAEMHVLHEFAHILTYKTYGACCHHDERFCHMLWKVAETWYGDASLYPWEMEYVTVTKYGRRRIASTAESDGRAGTPSQVTTEQDL